MDYRRHNSTVALACAITLISINSVRAMDVDAFWIPGSISNWNDPSAWVSGSVPSNNVNASFTVFIDDEVASISQTTLNTNVVITNLNIGANDSLYIDNARRLYIDGGTINSAGHITIGSTVSNTYLHPRFGPVTLTGGGTLSLSNSANNWIYQLNGGSLINQNQTIRGSGNLGWTSSPTNFDNQALIVADQPLPLLLTGGGTSVVTNTGILRAENGGQLRLNSATVENNGGIIEALDDSTVALFSSIVRGGTFQTTGTGEIATANGSNLLDGRVDAINNTGTIRIANAHRIYANGTLDNTGTIRLDSTVSPTYLQCSDEPLTLTGGGTIALSNAANNLIYRDGNGSLVNIDNNIRGSGRIGWTSAPTNIDNQGTIVADQSVPLSIQGGVNAVLTNTGSVRAENGATLNFQSAVVENDGGVIEALDNSTVTMASTVITHGTLQTQGTGVIQSADANAYLANLTNAGNFAVPNANRVYLTGNIENTGNIDVVSVASNTYLHVTDGDVVLTGGGTVNFSDHPNNWLYSQGPVGKLINMDNTIRGSGRLGWTSSPTNIDNHGLIVADQANLLSISSGTGATFRNFGTVRAENGATLAFSSANVDNAGGVIEALAGSTVSIASTNIVGGTIQTSGDGVIQSGNTTAGLDGVTNTGLYLVPSATRVYLSDTIDNEGRIELASTGSATYIHPNSNPTVLTGGGDVVLSDQTNNWIYPLTGGNSLINVDNTIRGAGRVGWSSAPMNITNQGTIIADGVQQLWCEGATMLFDNQGTMIAEGTGGLLVTGGFTTSGQVIVNESSSLTRSGIYEQTAGSTTVNGELSASGGIELNGGSLGGSGTVNGDVTNAGSIGPGESAGVLTLNDALMMDAAGEILIELGGTDVGNEYDRLVILGNADLHGTLRVELIDEFEPQVGDEFVVMTFAASSGALVFDAPCLPGGLSLQVSQTDTSIILSVGDGALADVTCDCAVSAADIDAMVLALLDFNAYQANYPDCNGTATVDLNEDGSVNGLDLQSFVDAYLP